MIKRLIVLAAVAVIAGGSLIGCGKKAGEGQQVKIEGSTTLAPLATKWADDFMKKNPEVKLTLNATGSGAGITALIEGRVECAMASREINASEQDKCKGQGFEAKNNVMAWDGMTIVVNKDNPINEITKEQLAKIYMDKSGAKNWKDIFPDKGFDQAFTVISRDKNSGTFDFFNEAVLDKKAIRDDAMFTASNQEVVNKVATDKGAVGYVGLGYYLENKDKLKALKYSAKEGKYFDSTDYANYPLLRPLHLYTKGEPQGTLADYIKYALSPEGQKTAEESGFIPVEKIKR